MNRNKQNKNKHNLKVKIARKLLSREEIKNHTPIFNSKNWNKRRYDIQK